MEKIKYSRKKVVLKEQLALHAMMLLGVILATVFSILPMIGLVMAFQKYSPSQGFFGSQFVDFWQFKKLFSRPDFWLVTFNTVWIALLKIIFVSVLSIVVALLLNEVRNPVLKKSVQTIIFLPYFLSWALLGEIMVDMFSVSGMFNKFLGLFGANTGHYWISSGYLLGGNYKYRSYAVRSCGNRRSRAYATLLARYDSRLDDDDRTAMYFEYW